MISWLYGDDGSSRFDSDARTVIVYDTDGEIVDTRPYTQAENAQADAEADQAARLDDHEARIVLLEDAVFVQAPDPGRG